MASGLPKLEKKYYSTKLPICGKTIQYTPLTVGQQKTIMMLETEDDNKTKQVAYSKVMKRQARILF